MSSTEGSRAIFRLGSCLGCAENGKRICWLLTLGVDGNAK
jgi:hypothetical protein